INDEATATEPKSRPTRARFRRPVPALLAGIAVCGALAGGWLLRDLVGRRSSAVPPRLPEGLAWFWHPFVPPAPPPLVVLPVHPLLRAAHGGDSPAIWERGHVIPKDELPEFRDTIHFRELPEFRFVPSTTDFTAVGEALGLLNLSELLAGAGEQFRKIQQPQSLAHRREIGGAGHEPELRQLPKVDGVAKLRKLVLRYHVAAFPDRRTVPAMRRTQQRMHWEHHQRRRRGRDERMPKPGETLRKPRRHGTAPSSNQIAQ